MVESNIRPVRRGIIVAIAVLTVGISALSSCTSRSPTSPSVLQEKMQVRVQELPASRATAAQGGQLAVAAHQHLPHRGNGIGWAARGHSVLQLCESVPRDREAPGALGDVLLGTGAPLHIARPGYCSVAAGPLRALEGSGAPRRGSLYQGCL